MCGGKKKDPFRVVSKTTKFHELAFSGKGRYRKPIAERLTPTRQIRIDTIIGLATAVMPSKASDHFVHDKQGTMKAA